MMKENEKFPFALLINDIHISRNNISDFQKNWDEMLSVCFTYKVKEIIIGGDLWQARSSQPLSVLLAVKTALMSASRVGLHVTIAEGNHCKVDQESFLGYSHVFHNLTRKISVVDYFTTIHTDKEGDADVCVMSYFPESGSFVGKLKKLEATKDFAQSLKHILYIHEGINGGLNTSTEGELPANLFNKWTKVLVGHYHDRKKIPGTNIEYIGASRQHNYGENEEKGYTIVYSDGSTKFVKNQVNTRYMTIDMTANNINDKIKENEAVLSDPLYQVRAKIRCSSKEAAKIDKTKLMEANINKIVFDTTDIFSTANQKALEVKYDKRGIKREYAQFCSEKDVDNVELGYKYLDKIN